MAKKTKKNEGSKLVLAILLAFLSVMLLSLALLRSGWIRISDGVLGKQTSRSIETQIDEELKALDNSRKTDAGADFSDESVSDKALGF